MTTLYLLRHGPAEDATGGMPDRERALSDDGRAKTRQACRGLKRLGVAPGAILTSSAKRALQTAEIAAEALGFDRSMTISDDLCPGARPGAVLRALRPAEQDVLLVGHEPDLSVFGALLLGLDNPGVLAMSKAGAMALSFQGAVHPGGARLRWFLRRKELARIGR
jgi:phosphohistidine phosphatase